MSRPIELPTADNPAVLVQGDCADVLPSLPARCVDAIITDPPYAVPTIVAQGRYSTRNVGDLSVPETAFRVYFREFVRVLRPTGRIFVFCDGTSYPVIFRASYGLFPSSLLVWNKGRIGMGRDFRKSHELILHGWMPNTPVFTDGKGRRDVLDCPPVGDEREHDAQKPVDLIRQLLEVCGPAVLDPFMGSGTTGVACVAVGKQFIGIDIDPEHVVTAKRRVTRAMGGGLFAAKPARVADLFAEDPT